MKIDDIKGKKFRLLKDIVAVTYRKPKLKSGIILPDSITKTRVDAGRFYAVKVYDIGPKVRDLKKNDWVMVHEYSPLNLKGDIQENKLYFIEEKSIVAKLENWEEKESMVERKVNEAHLAEANVKGS